MSRPDEVNNSRASACRSLNFDKVQRSVATNACTASENGVPTAIDAIAARPVGLSDARPATTGTKSATVSRL